MPFKTVPGHEPLEVSEFGVCRYNGKIRKQTLTDNGYLKIRSTATGKDLKVHRAVAMAHLPPPPSTDHRFVCHGDNVRTNNYASNLRWDTRQGNEADKIRHGTLLCGEKHPNSKLTEIEVIAIIDDPRPQKEIAFQYAIGVPLVSMIKSGKRWAHVGPPRG